MNHAINCEISEKLSDNCTCGVDLAVPIAAVPPSIDGGGTPLDDLTMQKLCAEAMGLRVSYMDYLKYLMIRDDKKEGKEYDPLHNDEQAMALVKAFRLSVGPNDGDSVEWVVWDNENSNIEQMDGPDLNRCIVECVAYLLVNRKEITNK